MKEFKIVCDCITEQPDGTRQEKKNVAPLLGCGAPSYCRRIFSTLEEAERFLSEWRFSIEEHDKRTAKNKNGIKYHQTNLHIVSRTVSEWE